MLSSRRFRRMVVHGVAAKPCPAVPSTKIPRQQHALTKGSLIGQHESHGCQPGPSSSCEDSTRWAVPSWLTGGPGATLFGFAAAAGAGLLGR